jgi:hypothetical protein
MCQVFTIRQVFGIRLIFWMRQVFTIRLIFWMSQVFTIRQVFTRRQCFYLFFSAIFLYIFLHSYLVCADNLTGADILELLG